MERQLVADQALWRRVPTALAAILCPLEILLLGWSTGWPTAVLTVVFLSVASISVPQRLRASIYLIDLLEWLISLPLELFWLALVWHLWVREPLFPVLGQPLIGSIATVAALWAATRFLSLAVRFATQQSPLGAQR